MSSAAQCQRKSAYISFCEKHPDLPIFLRPWWLDADAGKENWDVVLCHQNNHIIGTYPYVHSSLKFFKGIGMPPVAPYQGFYLAEPNFEKKSNRLKWRHKAAECLFSQLPKKHFFYQHLFPGLTDWMPYYKQGCQQTTRYTHILSDISKASKIYEAFENRAKHIIRKSEKELIVEIHYDTTILAGLVCKTFQKQNLHSPFSFNSVQNIIHEISKRDCGVLMVVKDKRREIHAASLMVWDGEVAYYLIQGSCPTKLPHGGASLLIWSAIQLASEKGCKIFDFTGSMMPGVSLFLRSFGTELFPHHYISKENTMLFYWLMRGKNFMEVQRRKREME